MWQVLVISDLSLINVFHSLLPSYHPLLSLDYHTHIMCEDITFQFPHSSRLHRSVFSPVSACVAAVSCSECLLQRQQLLVVKLRQQSCRHVRTTLHLDLKSPWEVMESNSILRRNQDRDEDHQEPRLQTGTSVTYYIVNHVYVNTRDQESLENVFTCSAIKWLWLWNMGLYGWFISTQLFPYSNHILLPRLAYLGKV